MDRMKESCEEAGEPVGAPLSRHLERDHDRVVGEGWRK